MRVVHGDTDRLTDHVVVAIRAPKFDVDREVVVARFVQRERLVVLEAVARPESFVRGLRREDVTVRPTYLDALDEDVAVAVFDVLDVRREREVRPRFGLGLVQRSSPRVRV